ncbi:MAG: 2-oxoglutarate dehydrogenase complex dihydrolipoyllysine-residue succinyltransferase [Gammaproteobacteria bacterium]|nr:2-oxoglutarate dehydrogenase complex dihydrolipoyllysine-residue succinyltransferase [Gammaproteobacteria bacterium]
MIEIKAPVFPESIADGEVACWHVQAGQSVKRDQLLVDIETDKVVLEVVAPADGTLVEILKGEGETVLAEELLATLAEGEVEGTAVVENSSPAPTVTAKEETKGKVAAMEVAEESTSSPDVTDAADGEALASPSARRLAEENRIDVTRLEGSGRGGRVTKEDVLKAVADSQRITPPATPGPRLESSNDDERLERRVPMTRLRASIARRLVEAQQTAAMLTTFNEVDMSAIIELRAKYKDAFASKHEGVRLGFMSFFVRASVEALKRFPAVNASIDGNDIVYHGYQDVGVAVSSPRGLVVPIIRDADSLTLAEMEQQISEYGQKARDGKLSIEEMSGGTFTISNGGVFGSMLSTPILNPPQTAILGMHKIQDRAMVINGEILVRPMMYLALSYDHRLIDGQEAVSFLVTIKDFLEEPARILLDL